MRWRVGLLGVVSLGAAFSLTNCVEIVGDEFRDGALCSAAGTCPPGQRCSFDGMCLRPCPTPDCTGEGCGCGEWDTFGYPSGNYTCHEDGLCHFRCDVGCDDRMSPVCDQSQGLCKHRCYGGDQYQYCPPGTTCVEDGQDGYCDVEVCVDECDSRCVVLAEDPAHCGRCGHDCLGGDCVDGRCQPAPLVENAWYPSGGDLNATQDTVYWAVDSAGWAIHACATTGCAQAETVCQAPGCGQPAKLTASTDTLYWRDVSLGDDRILRCPKTGCAGDPTVVVEGLGSAVGPGWAGDGLYFLSTGGLQRCLGADCSSGVEHLYDFTPAPGDVSFVVDSTTVILTLCSSDQVLACPKGGCGGTPSVIYDAPGAGGCPQHPKLKDGQVYFVLGHTGQVMRCPVAGCGTAPEVVGTIPPVSEWAITSFKLSPHGAYALDPDGALWHCDIGTAPTGCAIYWQDETIQGLSINGQAVFFGSFTDPRIFRLAPP